MSDFDARRARLEPLFESARSLADASSERGHVARQRLLQSSGLSPQGLDFAMERCLEIAPSEAEIATLIRSTPTAQSAHVLLSANVFVAAHRAIAIALAASDSVFVRPSRREPEMAELLLAGAPGTFSLVPVLAPRSGDRVWAYGSDETMDQVAVTLPPGVALHPHGSGFGVCVLDADAPFEELVPRLVEDVVLFDQRGCLSPRAVLVQGDSARAIALAQALATALNAIEVAIPRGRLAAEELAEISRHRETASFVGEVLTAGLGYVSVGTAEQFVLPPIGRNLHLMPTSDPLRALAGLRPMLTSCGFAGAPAMRTALQRALPGARVCSLGDMQRPPFDGPVDRREL